MENRAYGTTQNIQQNQPTQVNSNPVVNPVNTPATNNKSFIAVTSPDEAWNHMADLTGAKQFYYDEVNNAFYVKWFSVSEPKTYKAIYKPVDAVNEPVVSEVTGKEESKTEGIVEGINELTGKVDDLITYIKENPFVYMKDVAKPKAKKVKEED